MSPDDKQLLQLELHMLLVSGDITLTGARKIVRIFNLEESR